MNCLQCDKELKSYFPKKFCNRSCSASYNNARRDIDPEWWKSQRVNKVGHDGETLKIKHKVCKECGESIDHEVLGPNVKYCSETCKIKQKQRKRESSMLEGVSKALSCQAPYEGKKYYMLNSQGRNSIAIYNIDDGKHYKTISYAKYLVSVHLGRILEQDEEVDHINNDKSDDRLENLQILSREGNFKKWTVEVSKGEKMVEMICPCGTKFVRRKGNTHLVNSAKLNTFCSRQCSGRLGKLLTETKTMLVREFQKHK